MTDIATGILGQGGVASEGSAIAFIVQRLTASHTHAHIVQVKAVHAAGVDGMDSKIGTVDVQPMVHQIDGAGKTTPHGIIYGLPYVRFQSGSLAILMDPVVDDIGLAIFCDRDTSEVRKTKAPAKPATRRRFDWADGVYIGCLLGKAPEHILAFSQEGVDDPSRGIVGAKGIIIASSLPIQIIGNLVVTGQVIAGYGGADQVGLQSHIHSQPPDGDGDSEQPTNPPTPGF